MTVCAPSDELSSAVVVRSPLSPHSENEPTESLRMKRQRSSSDSHGADGAAQDAIAAAGAAAALLSKTTSSSSAAAPAAPAAHTTDSPGAPSSLGGDSSDTAGGERPRKQRRPWSNAEDDLLRAAVAQHNGSNWKEIAKAVPGRTHVQCLQRWSKSLHPDVIKGRWTTEEDNLLLQIVAQTPHLKNWGYAAKHIPGRSAKQCRERYVNHLNPAISKRPWSREEDVFIVEAHHRLGNKWTEIASYMQGRTENAIKLRLRMLEKQSSRSSSSSSSASQMIGVNAAAGMASANLMAAAAQQQQQLQHLQQDPGVGAYAQHVPPLPLPPPGEFFAQSQQQQHYQQQQQQQQHYQQQQQQQAYYAHQQQLHHQQQHPYLAPPFADTHAHAHGQYPDLSALELPNLLSTPSHAAGALHGDGAGAFPDPSHSFHPGYHVQSIPPSPLTGPSLRPQQQQQHEQQHPTSSSSSSTAPGTFSHEQLQSVQRWNDRTMSATSGSSSSAHAMPPSLSGTGLLIDYDLAKPHDDTGSRSSGSDKQQVHQSTDTHDNE